MGLLLRDSFLECSTLSVWLEGVAHAKWKENLKKEPNAYKLAPGLVGNEEYG